jgi:hypothetical protein
MPVEAHLILVSKKQSTVVADTLVFSLIANIDELTAKVNCFFISFVYLKLKIALFY